MIINFWQNVLSIHQLPFLEEICLNKNIKVNLIVCELSNSERKKMGWEAEIPSSINLKYIGDINISDCVANSDVNVFSGFFAYKDLNEAFSICRKKDKEIFIYSEGKDDVGFRGYLRVFRDFLLWKFISNSKIKFLAIGDKGKKWFLRVGVPSSQIIKFGYFTKYNSKESILEKPFNGKMIFIGRLLPSKGIMELLNAFNDYRLKGFTLDIYGNGILEEDINSFININNLSDRVRRYDFVTNKIMREKLLDYDVLMLPNVGDEGWGAVVNEALQSGLKVICSTKTGASCLIFASGAGFVLTAVNNESLINAVLQVESLGKSRKEIFDWSNRNISPKVAADKFIAIINGIDDRFEW
ncbi:glycosyltransferase [Acinetobacter lwoffii]|uniref:glycosyltransferase n=1 Tax=Acinetobacter lwoffii TaxID=28090 RepID=UPI0002CD819E|nr:glycosyltransferase [Acinetobacter lwoffii]ENU64135.1 hypothetical protein F980_00129 [Acinetobacter lwoffii NIPH 715]